MQPWSPMSSHHAPTPTGRVRRPGTVNIGVVLLLAAVALCLVEVAIAIVGAAEQRDYSQVHYGTGSSDYKAITVVMVALVAVNVLLAAGLSGGALLTLRGRSGGRILALVVAVPAVLLRCGCGGLSGTGIYGASQGEVNPFPNWLFVADIAVDALALVALVLAVVLLLLRPSGEYFRAHRAAPGLQRVAPGR